MKWHALSWIINEDCNLQCAHCYPSSSPQKQSQIAQYNLNLIQAHLKSVHFDKVYLSGGEPLMCGQLPQILQIADLIGDKLYICTNSLLLNDNKLSLLAKFNVGITVSIQHTNPIKAASIYGDESVGRRILDRIADLRKQNIPIKLETTITQINVQDFENLIVLARKYGISEINFKRFRQIGRGAVYMNRLALTSAENVEALNTLYDLSNKYADIQLSTDDPFYGVVVLKRLVTEGYSEHEAKDYLEKHSIYGCKSGRRWVGLGSTGEVAPCPLLLYCGISIGNVLNKPMSEILANNDLLNKMQSDRCNHCKFTDICGGCRVCAFAQGDLFGVDPMCIL